MTNSLLIFLLASCLQIAKNFTEVEKRKGLPVDVYPSGNTEQTTSEKGWERYAW